MQQLTVAAAMTLPAFHHVQLVAGRTGTDRPIRTVNVMEVPDIADFVRQGDLLFTTGFPFKDAPDAMCGLIPVLVEREVAGLAVKLNRYIAEVPATLLEAADRLAFPVMLLPPAAAFSDYINPLLTEILHRQADVLRRSEAIYERFTRVVAGGGRYPEITAALADLTGAQVVLYDGDLPVQSSFSTPLSDLPRFAAIPGAHARHSHLGRLLLREAVLVGGQVFGHVTLWGENPADEVDQRAVQHAATVLGLELQRQERLRELKRRYASQFLIDFLEGRLLDTEEAAARARLYGLPISRLTALLVIQIDGVRITGGSGGPDFDAHLSLLSERFGIVEEVCARAGIEHFLFEHNGLFHLLYAPPGPRDPQRVAQTSRQLATQILTALDRCFSQRSAAGIGRYYGDFARLPASSEEAQTALAAALQLGRRVVEFTDLGIARLLIGKSQKELAGFVDDMLGPLLRYDESTRSDLIETLERYLETGGIAKETAKRMHLHYNTIRYRLGRIQDLLGHPLDEPHRRAALQVALQARRIKG